MKVQGTDILSEATEKTSRNLKATAAAVIAVKAFCVPVDNLRILNVDLPANLFDVVAFALVAYMMAFLALYWRFDYLLWRDGPILAAMNTLNERLRGVGQIMEQIERSAEPSAEQIRHVEDHYATIKKDVLDQQRAIAQTTEWIRFVILWFHRRIPLGLGAIAIMMIVLADWLPLTCLCARWTAG
jgi:hypothetical protein